MSGRYLSFAEREDIAIWHAQKLGVREIARRLGRSPSTISRELRRNASTRTWRLEYRASTAQWHAERRARRPKTAKLVANERLRDYVQDRLAGVIRRRDGTPVLGPEARWKGRNKPHRQDRRWATSWSPEQIANRLPVDFPDDESMRISHEAIYQALYVQSRGALKRELVACLRTGRALRVPRARARQRPGGHVTAEVMISERPAEAEDRAVPGHWEGDLIIGLNRSAIGTARRAHHEVHDAAAPAARWRATASSLAVKNGPALAGYGAEAMRDALGVAVHDAARAAAPLADLGPRQGARPARPAQDRHRPRRLLRRPAQPMAARHEREHQRAAAPVLPQGHRPVPLERRRDRSRRRRAQQPAPQDPRLEDTRRGPRRTPTLPPTRRCCDDRLNPVSTRHGRSGGGCAPPGCSVRWAPSATRWTTPSPRASSGPCRSRPGRHPTPEPSGKAGEGQPTTALDPPRNCGDSAFSTKARRVRRRRVRQQSDAYTRIHAPASRRKRRNCARWSAGS